MLETNLACPLRMVRAHPLYYFNVSGLAGTRPRAPRGAGDLPDARRQPGSASCLSCCLRL